MVADEIVGGLRSSSFSTALVYRHEAPQAAHLESLPATSGFFRPNEGEDVYGKELSEENITKTTVKVH